MKKLLISICVLISLIALNCEEQGSSLMNPPSGPLDETFITVTRITPNGIQAGDKFASAIDATLEFTAVGAIGDDTKGTDVGAVYLLQREGLNFSSTSKILYPDQPTNEDAFGFSVALDGDLLVVGSPYNDKFGEDAGLAFIFQNQGGLEWQLIKELASPTPSSGDLFGYAVSIDQGKVAVSSWQDIENYYDTEFITNGAGEAQGSVYVFDQDNDWTIEGILVAGKNIGDRWDNFGRSLCIKGNQIAVGAPGLGNTSYQGPGRVYLFEQQNNSWALDSYFESEEGQDQDFFGSQLDFDGNVVVVTAPGNYNKLLTATLNIEGAAFVFNKNGAGWKQTHKLLANAVVADDDYGSGGIVLNEDYVVVGAPNSGSPLQFAGSAHLFHYGSWEWSHEIIAPDAIGLDQFAGTLAAANDMLFVGAPRKCNGDGCLAGGLYFVY